ncbi:MAG: creatininase family protein [Gemmatimonadetes bacterium]|nr:creatininase family protein [Gemmatimonadota bacterium]
MRQVQWERMFPDQLEAAYDDCPLVYFTYGLCEPHGPHDAVGLDGLKAHGIACEAARAHGGIVAPPDFWHIHELGGYALWLERTVGQAERSWMTCMPPWQHFKNICYHIRMADHLRFHAAIFITGHYGPNWKDLKTLIDLVQPHVGTRLCGLPDSEANKPGFDNDGQSGGDHAGKVETSLLWALHPDCVDLSRLPPEDAPGPHFAMGPTVRKSDRRVGERMVTDEVRWLGEKAKELLGEYGKANPDHKLQTYEDVEMLWETVVGPALSGFETMQDSWSGESLPETSVWHPNWRVPNRG